MTLPILGNESGRFWKVRHEVDAPALTCNRASMTRRAGNPDEKGTTLSSISSRTHDVKSIVADKALVKQRRAQIVAGAVELFSKKEYHQTTVEEVARRAGISTGLIYRYVSDKEDLLLLSILDVLDSYAVEIPAALEGVEGPLERCTAAFVAYCKVVDKRREATLLAYRSTISLRPERQRLVREAEQETNRLLGTCIEKCIEEGLFRPVDGDIAAYQLVMYAHAWALKYWHFVKRVDLETYISRGLDLFLHAMLTEQGWQEHRSSGTPGPSSR